jgi:hypothetical protein
MLASVSAPHFNAGLIVEDGVCVRAAPILKWTLGKRWAWLHSYFLQKGWEVICLD